jgi:hypothetical protein
MWTQTKKIKQKFGMPSMLTVCTLSNLRNLIDPQVICTKCA